MALLQVEKQIPPHSPSYMVLLCTYTWGHTRAFPPGPLPNKMQVFPADPFLGLHNQPSLPVLYSWVPERAPSEPP